MSKLFSEFSIRGVNIKNRIVMAPMCMYSAGSDGMANEWYFVHYASRAAGGCGLIIVEATGVESCGRITERDLGIWKDEHIEGLGKIVQLIKANGAIPAIQLAHAGRKSTVSSERIIAPSALAFNDEYKVPEEMTVEDIKNVVNSFRLAAERAIKAGFEIIEIHGAHGYLISEFLSPLTNRRTDEYGGGRENRARFLKEVLQAVREVWTHNRPLIVRVSAEDFSPEGNHPEDLADLLNFVKDEGIDLVDVSSGGVIDVAVKAYPGYQVGFADVINERTGLPVIAGGLLTESKQCEDILASGKVDMVFLGRELLRNPYWPFKAAHELKADIEWPVQYERGRYGD